MDAFKLLNIDLQYYTETENLTRDVCEIIEYSQNAAYRVQIPVERRADSEISGVAIPM